MELHLNKSPKIHARKGERDTASFSFRQFSEVAELQAQPRCWNATAKAQG
jgi:hypothetical protein